MGGPRVELLRAHAAGLSPYVVCFRGAATKSGCNLGSNAVRLWLSTSVSGLNEAPRKLLIDRRGGTG